MGGADAMSSLYDPKCYELAEHFLEDVEVADEADRQRKADELAALIQMTIEDQIAEWRK
jgi:hypothetical protein